MTCVLLTGANGFIGRALCSGLADAGYSVRAAIRETASRGDEPDSIATAQSAQTVYAVGDIGAEIDWLPVLQGVDFIIHLAARAHVLKETTRDPLAAYRHVNVLATRRLAHAAARLEVRRFVYVSSAGVLGSTTPGEPFTETAAPNPHSPYTLSKLEAEQALREIEDETGLEVTIVRPVLVYGAGVGANFLRMMNWVRRGIPLPLASVTNLRSFCYVDNLVDLLIICMRHPRAAGATFLASDGQDISTPALIKAIAAVLGTPARLFPAPLGLLGAVAKISGKSREFESLCGSLVVDSSRSRDMLQRREPFTFEDGLEKTVEWFAGL